MSERRIDPQVIEGEAAKQILQKGVCMQMRAPFLLRVFGRKTVSIVVRSPFYGTLMKVSQLYLSLGIKDERLKGLSIEDSLALMSAHGKVISEAVATAWLNGKWRIRLLAKPLSRYMMRHCKPEELLVILNMVLLHGGVKDFLSTTRLVRDVKMTSPMNLGQEEKGS